MIASRSLDAYPSTSPTTIGKNVTRATNRIFGVKPKPNQITTSGASTIRGIVWLPTSTGISDLRAMPEA